MGRNQENSSENKLSSEDLILKMSPIACLLMLVGCFQVFNPDNHNESIPEPNTKYNQTSSPIGGGKDYTDIILVENADYAVKSVAELKRALNEAHSGEIIFVPGDIELDLSNTSQSLKIPAKVTLASNRGYKGSKGALLFTTSFKNRNMIEIIGDSVRLTGLRIEGPDKEIRNSRDALPRINGVSNAGSDYLEIDNSEIFGWSFGGIYLRDSKDTYIHHNHIHLNRRRGLGYGIVLYSDNRPTNALIEANYFRYNRHSIAGSGQLGVSYEARYNYITRNTTSHSFDMHGDHEKPGSGTKYAGNEIRIHHNTFNTKNQGVVIRGIPKEGAWIYENNFIRSPQDVSIRQKNFFGNMRVYNNKFMGSQKAWYVSWRGTEAWYSLKTDPAGVGIENTYLGDFNGDHEDDLLVRTDKFWYILFSGQSHYGHSDPRILDFDLSDNVNTSHIFLTANFYGNSTDQVVRVSNGTVYIADIVEKRWIDSIELPEGTIPDNVRIGDFDSNGKDGLFAFDGSNWFVSYGASKGWDKVRQQSVNPDQILVGKFTNKDSDDILMLEDGDVIMHSFAPNPLRSASADINDGKKGPYITGDFDGDGLSDLMAIDNRVVNIKYSAQNTWEITKEISIEQRLNVSEIKVGDFNGDGISDILINDTGLW